MSVATLDDLQDRLDADLSWRRIELTALYNVVRSHCGLSASSPAARVLCRSLITISYAHWEGYVKTATSNYVSYLKKRRIKVDEANEGLAFAHLTRLFKAANSGDSTARSELISIAAGGSARIHRLDVAELTNTKSNLRFSVLDEISRGLSIKFEFFETKKERIDRELCDRRNDIAHGQYLDVDFDSVSDTFNFVMDALQEWNNLVYRSAADRHYMR